MSLAGHLYRVTMQKVPKILRQKTVKIFSNQKADKQKQQTLKRKMLICHLEGVLSKTDNDK